MMKEKFNSKTFKDFTYHYRAQVRPARTPYREAVYKPYSFSRDMDRESMYEQTITTRDVNAVEITMPEESFFYLMETNALINDPDSEWQQYQKMCRYYGLDCHTWISEYVHQIRKESREKALRESIPALQSAWEQYQFTLELVK